MNRLGARFDRWVETGPFTPHDLGTYRVLYAGLMLLALPSFRWVDAFPDSLFDPPIGPFQLLPGLPPEPVMLAVEVALAISLAALALGYRTVVASLAVTLLLLFGFGVSYSLGKIDHSIFVVLVPAVLLFARWGDAFSVDALRRAGRGADLTMAPTPQWPMRLLALLIGLGFVTAAVPKILSGWLDPRTQAVQSLIGQRYDGESGALLASLAVDVHLPALWETADVFAVAIECVVLLTVPWWRAFRVVLACAALFHVGVLLTMGIAFSNNVLVYGAFVSWSALWAAMFRSDSSRRTATGPSRMPSWRRAWWLEPAALLLSVALGVGAWFVDQQVSSRPLLWVIIFAGAGVGAWYLGRQVVLLARPRRRRPRHLDLTDPMRVEHAQPRA